MIRSTAFEAAVVGALAALASLCALNASAAEPYSVVAQSNRDTAGSGRRPLATRIASGRLPSRPVPQAKPAREEASPPTNNHTSHAVTLERVKQVLARRSAVTEPAAASASLAENEDAPAEDTRAEASETETSQAEVPPAEDPEFESAPQPVAVLAAAPATTFTPQAPARLEFEVRESTAFLAEGDRVIVNVAVRNIGPTPARNVETALFFADGIEPVKTTGHAAAIASGEVRLAPIDTLDPGDTVIVAVTAIGVRPGRVVYRGELECAELPGVLAREGALKIEPRLERAADE